MVTVSNRTLASPSPQTTLFSRSRKTPLPPRAARVQTPYKYGGESRDFQIADLAEIIRKRNEIKPGYEQPPIFDTDRNVGVVQGHPIRPGLDVCVQLSSVKTVSNQCTREHRNGLPRRNLLPFQCRCQREARNKQHSKPLHSGSTSRCFNHRK